MHISLRKVWNRIEAYKNKKVDRADSPIYTITDHFEKAQLI